MSETVEITSNDRLGFTFFITVAVHAFIYLAVGWDIQDGKKIAPMLNVTLATQQSNKEPEKADFLAQHNQQASGTEAEVRELTAKEVAMFNDTHIRDVSEAPREKAQKRTENQLQLIQTSNSSDLKAENKELLDEKEAIENREGESEDTIIENPEFASLQAKLDRIIQERAKQPRIRRLTSVDTKKSYDAKYLHDFTQKVEIIGNQNFPELAIQNKIFGSLRLTVTILPNGFVDRIEVEQSSGHNILDEAAKHIVKLASPFAPFPKEIRDETDRIEIIRTWRFEITGLKTTR